jgi:hypothetical protein
MPEVFYLRLVDASDALSAKLSTLGLNRCAKIQRNIEKTKKLFTFLGTCTIPG